jgi:hypothetical protein
MKQLVLGLVLAPLMAFADIEIVSLHGASSFENSSSNSLGLPIVYGGTGGLQVHCNEEDAQGRCNTCNDLKGQFAVCNEKRVYDDLVLTVQFRSDLNTSSGQAFLQTKVGERIRLVGASAELAAKAVHTVEVQWQTLCNEMGMAGTCEGLSDSVQLDLVIEQAGQVKDSQSIAFVIADPDPAKTGDLDTIDLCEDSQGTASEGGVCDFKIHGGNHFVRFARFEANGSFPNQDVAQVESLRVFISDMSFTEIVDPNSGLMPQDLKVRVSEDGHVDVDRLVTGLRPKYRILC